jgi:outer membrane murein-binding lipoprotein Lpp
MERVKELLLSAAVPAEKILAGCGKTALFEQNP